MTQTATTKQIRSTNPHNPDQEIAYRIMKITCDDIGQQTKALDFLLASFPTIASDCSEDNGDLFEGLYYVLSGINNEIKKKVGMASAIYKQGCEVNTREVIS